MTSFEKPEANTETKTAPPETKPSAPPPPAVILESRLIKDPKKWADALLLSEMLTYCRPEGSRTEEAFVSRYLVPLGGFFDKYGNFYKQVGLAPTVLWSSHTDTVHSTKGFQKIEYWVDNKTGDTFFGVMKGQKSSCLGADDTCGVWLMMEMIKREVPGLYIFHRAEEVGRKGSRWIAENNPNALKGIKFAIAFDRKGEKSIITYQNSKKCCSTEFAKSLGGALGMGHEGDTTGSFTDTASYVDLVAECSNVSVGYNNAHFKSENTNVDYLFKLRDAVCAMDLKQLVEARKPGDNSYKTYSYPSYSYPASGGTQNNNFFRGTGRTTEELEKMWGGYKWLDEYEWDSVTGLWYYAWDKSKRERKAKVPAPAEASAKDLGVTKLSPEARKAKKSRGTASAASATTRPDAVDRAVAKAQERSVRNSTSGRRGTYNEAVCLIRENPEIIADLLEGMGYGPNEIDDHILMALGQMHNPF